MKKFTRYALTGLRAALIFVAVRVLSGEVLQYAAQLDMGGEWGIRNLFFKLFPYDILTAALAAAILMAVIRAPGPRLRGWEAAFSAIVAALWLLGYSFNATDGWGLLFGRALSVALSVLTYAGLVALTATALRWLRAWTEKLAGCKLRLPAFFERHVFLVSWAVIFLCWLPFAVIRYPAGIEFDAYYQMEQFLGFRDMTAHWPPFSSAVMGSFVWLGDALFGSWDVGVFAFVIFQMLVSSAIFAYTVKTMKDLGVAAVWRGVSLLIYAVATIYPGYLTAVLKDALFSAVTVLFVTLLVRQIMLKRTALGSAALGAAALLMCLLRNNGIYVLLPVTAVVCLWAVIKRRRGSGAMAIALAAACVLNTGYQKLLLPALDIPAGSVAEALSVPFQQTARFVRDFPEDVTGEEREIIGAVLDYDALGGIYDPDLSDPVKNTYHGDTGALVKYVGVWVRQFFRHPGVYFQATLANSCGYYYPNAQNLVFYSDTRNYDKLIFNEPEGLRGAKADLYSYVALFESLPVLMLIGSCGANAWVALYLVMRELFARDRRRLFLLLPSAIGVLVCLASPTYTVNGVRYALPYIYATPIMLGLCVFSGRGEEINKESRGKEK